MNKNSLVLNWDLISVVFLVGGTCIGGGMLALPVASGVSGFLPSIVVMVICWLAMTCSALFLMEASLWMKEGDHIISMSSKLLGRTGEVISWCLYLFICYASIVAYTAGGGLQIAFVIDKFFDLSVGKEMGCVSFVILFGMIICFGSHVVGRVNAILFVSMIAAYFLLVGLTIPEVKTHFLTHRNWSMSLMAVPVLLSCFSFHTMVPSLTPLLKSNPMALRFTIIGGSSIALIVYVIWQWVVLGIVPPQGVNSLATALEQGEPATKFIYEQVGGFWIPAVAEYFAFFALVTSFLGMTLGLFDFLADGLKVKKTGTGKIFLALLIAIPTLFFAIYFERVFLVALEITGGYGDSILNGMIPVLMVWAGRYRLNYSSEYRFFGGKPLLILVFLFFLASLLLEIFVHTGHLVSIYNVREVRQF